MVSKSIKRGTSKENVWEHGNIGQFWKGAREQGPPLPLGDPHIRINLYRARTEAAGLYRT